LAANSYLNSSSEDFFFGPVASNYNTAFDVKYNKVWNVSQQDILNHINGVSSTPDILNWPGNGDTLNGEAFMLAPFRDLNANNVYEPSLGEYPAIRGEQALYVIYNDDRAPHTFSNSSALGVEVHAMIYQYDAADYLGDVTFAHYTIFNRSLKVYQDVIVGQFTDFDLGNPNDDFYGCDVPRNTQFGYNGDAYDDDLSFGIKGFGANMPSQAITILNDIFKTSVFITQSGPSYSTGPNTASEFYGYLNGRWKDASPMVQGGIGHSSDPNASSNIYSFLYDGDVEDSLAWNETMVGNPPADRRSLASIEPKSLAPGEFICLDVAFTHNISQNSNKESVNELLLKVDSVQSFYNVQTDLCYDFPVSSGVLIEDVINLNLYPNPVNDNLHLEGEGLLGALIHVYDAAGKLVVFEFCQNESMVLDLADLSNGVYALRVVTEEGFVVRQFVKN